MINGVFKIFRDRYKFNEYFRTITDILFNPDKVTIKNSWKQDVTKKLESKLNDEGSFQQHYKLLLGIIYYYNE